MPDLSAQIRAVLDAWAQPQPTGIVEIPEPLSEQQYADLVARFKAGQEDGPWKIRELPPSPINLMRNALLAVLAEHDGDADALAAGWQKFAFGTPTPEEKAEREARWATLEAERAAKHAAAVAEWEQQRARYADVPAVLAVLDIHQPADDGSLECAHPVFGWESDAEDWPCSTYEAIRDAT